MERTMHAQQTNPAGFAPPRATFPTSTRIHERTDRRLREMADALVRLNGKSLEGASRRLMRLEGFSDWELDHYGADAELLANTRFVRQDAVTEPEPPTDEMLIAEAVKLFDPGFDRLLIKLRARPDFNEDVLGRIWPRIATGAAARLARHPLPARL
jgi:hypothetical protein